MIKMQVMKKALRFLLGLFRAVGSYVLIMVILSISLLSVIVHSYY